MFTSEWQKLVWTISLFILTDDLPRLHHAAAGGHHGVADLLPSLAVLHRAAREGEHQSSEWSSRRQKLFPHSRPFGHSFN